MYLLRPAPKQCSGILTRIEQVKRMQKDQPEPSALPEQGAAGADVDRIRDILFGAKMQDYDQRFDAVEQRLGESVEQLRQSLTSRVAHIETFMKEELERLANKQVAERKDRVAALEALNESLGRLDARMQDGLDDLEESGAKDRMALRNELLEQSSELNEALRQRSEELRNLLNQETRRLQQDKTGREEMSRLMSEVAMRLSGEFQLPEA